MADEKKRTPEEVRRARAEGGKKGGRPPKPIDWNLVTYLASIDCTEAEIAASLGIRKERLTHGKNAKVMASIVAGGTPKVNVSIRRVLVGTLRGRLIDPETGAIEHVPMDERIAMAKYLATKKRYLDLESAATDLTSGGKPLNDGVKVMTVIVSGEPEEDER